MHKKLLQVAILFAFLPIAVVSFSQTLVRGPYLQMGNQTAITIRWKTNTFSDSKLDVGEEFGNYTITLTDEGLVQEHIMRVTGLQPDKKYFYRVGTKSKLLEGSEQNFFITAPEQNTKRKMRFTFFGDCGRGDVTYQDENLANYLNYLKTNAIEAPDALLLLGDNAYATGSEFQYNTKFFGVYGPTILKNHKLYPAPGNHDYANDELMRTSRTIPYYSIFTTPQMGECGGIASYKPNHYSFDIGNVHFLSLDSWGIEYDHTEMGSEGKTALKDWIKKDLSENKGKWVVAYWHHPPYSRGSHNSDLESELANIRYNFIDDLEKAGVDLVVTGHSHNYERGYLLKDFRGSWNSFSPETHAVSTSSATYTSATTCPYVYKSSDAHHGTVYVVAGSTGASGTTRANFGTYAFPFSVNDGGIFYVEVEDNRLDAKMLRRDGTIFDRFTIIKDANKKHKERLQAGTAITLTASWPAEKYNWSNGATERSINVTPAPGVSELSVTDDFGCVTDQFSLSVLTPLPVTLTRFQAHVEERAVQLSWTTGSETNSSHFMVERAVDGVHFEPIARVPAAGNATTPRHYRHADASPLKGTTFYRLAQSDKDGKVQYSEIKTVKVSNGKSYDVRLAAAGRQATAHLQMQEPRAIKVVVYDVSGKTLQTAVWQAGRGNSQFRIDLQKGVQFLRFEFENGETEVRKILIR